MGKSTEPLKTRQYVTAETLTKVSVSAFCSATCKLLCISCLTEIRVVVFTTLKMPKALIASRISVAHPVSGVNLLPHYESARSSH